MTNVIKLSSMVPENAPPVSVQKAYHKAVGKHSHDFYELVYLRDGFCLHDVGGRMTLLMEGDMFIIPPEVPHRYIGNRMVNLYNCLFTTEAIADTQKDELTLLFSGGGYPRARLALNDRKSIVRQLNAMCDECNDCKTGWGIKLRGQLSGLLVDFMRIHADNISEGGERAMYSAYVSRALEYIDVHYSDAITVSGVAKASGVSPDYLTRQFRMVIGITPVEYMKRYRFARAMELLQSGNSVTSAAARVGFQNLCHFSREFKKALGVTPSQYRKQNHEGGNQLWH